ncbi:hypothetical protein ACMD2_24067 [Ananas comosus]|uniref:Transposase, Ptta/En/Spm, plant n=1 Tax=Ananas comosus TaxID=4615 RepID=A0A199VZI7_ANACO|nr:hypothetical protein ACMD2_24067 [Ananas comosus]
MAKLKRLRKIAEDNNSQTSEDDAAHFSRFNSLQAAAKPTSSHMESSQSEFSQTQPQVQESAETEYIDASKFLLPSNGNIEKWVLKSLSRKWKDFKCELKGKYMIDNYTEQEVASNVPSGFTSQQWIDLVRYWFSEKSKEKENGREPGRVEFFALTHKRKDGTYDGSSQEVLDNITKLIEKEAKTENEAFTEVIGKDRYGRVKGYGIGVTPTQLFGVHAQIKNMENGGVDPSEDMRKLQAQIQDMQRALRQFYLWQRSNDVSIIRMNIV